MYGWLQPPWYAFLKRNCIEKGWRSHIDRTHSVEQFLSLMRLHVWFPLSRNCTLNCPPSCDENSMRKHSSRASIMYVSSATSNHTALMTSRSFRSGWNVNKTAAEFTRVSMHVYDEITSRRRTCDLKANHNELRRHIFFFKLMRFNYNVMHRK